MRNSDLHTHSFYSDGDLSPSEVVKLAKNKGVRTLALTDHNSISGIEEAIIEGKKQGINIIPAIEIRAEEDEVLGYFIDYKNKELQREILQIQKVLVTKVKKIIKNLNKKGIEVSFEDLEKKYYPNKNFMEIHLVKYLASKGHGTIRELFDKYMKEDSETYVKIKEISVIEAIKLIKKYNGVPVLAHPWVDSKSKSLLEENNFKKLIDAGLKGIEIDNGDRDERRDEKIIKRIQELAKKYNLIITSGSDFHGEYLVKATGCHQIGENNCDGSVVEELKK